MMSTFINTITNLHIMMRAYYEKNKEIAKYENENISKENFIESLQLFERMIMNNTFYDIFKTRKIYDTYSDNDGTEYYISVFTGLINERILSIEFNIIDHCATIYIDLNECKPYICLYYDYKNYCNKKTKGKDEDITNYLSNVKRNDTYDYFKIAVCNFIDDIYDEDSKYTLSDIFNKCMNEIIFLLLELQDKWYYLLHYKYTVDLNYYGLLKDHITISFNDAKTSFILKGRYTIKIIVNYDIVQDKIIVKNVHKFYYDDNKCVRERKETKRYKKLYEKYIRDKQEEKQILKDVFKDQMYVDDIVARFLRIKY